MSRTVGCFVAAVLLMWAGQAAALKPGRHRKITRDSCRAAGLPRDFCRRAALESYNTDAHEWDNMAAHAQVPAGATTCEGAEGAGRRVWSLGVDLHEALRKLAIAPTDDDVKAAARALGRVAHTIQDNCAHHGMPNPQHAWYSLSDFCDGTSLSPDIQAEAVACANDETDILMQRTAEAVAAAGVASELGPRSCREDPWNDNNNRNPCDEAVLPGPWDACEFFEGAATWDGTDGRWDNARVRPWLDAAFRDGLNGTSAPPVSLCAGDPDALIPPDRYDPQDVSAGAPGCGLSHLMCLGKADYIGDFFADDLADEPAGCNATGQSSGGTALLLVGLILVAALRRRKVG